MKVGEIATGNDFFCKVSRGEYPDRKFVTENETTISHLFLKLLSKKEMISIEVYLKQKALLRDN